MPPQNPAPESASSGPGDHGPRPERVSAGSQEVPPDQDRAAAEAAPEALGPLSALVNAQNRWLQCYFRLERLEAKLSREARQRLPHAGRTAIRQMELERQRLGRDLHTGIGQLLAATRLQVETIEQQWPDPPPAVKQALERIKDLASQALDQVRAVSRRLHPPEWQRLTLAEAVRQLWDLSGLPERTAARIAISPGLPEPDLETKILLYRALQEALSNIAGHSRATAVSVTLEERGGRMALTVYDNGVGFDAPALWNSPARVGSGIGLRAVREQAAAMGGELSVRSGEGGTTLEVSVPLEEPPEE